MSAKFWPRIGALLLLATAIGNLSCSRRGGELPPPPSGHSGGNGSDLSRPEDGAAWFLGRDREIRACFERSPDFGPDDGALEAAVKRAFAYWMAYLDTNQIAWAMGAQAKTVELAHHLKWIGRCDGSESLTFFFGVSPPKVERAKQGFREPLAFAERELYDLKRGWGKGYVWIAPPASKEPSLSFPDWRYPVNLHAILLHEIGHVLGCDHVPGTIMDERLADRLRAFARSKAAGPTRENLRHLYRELVHFSNIDGDRELYHCEECAYSYAGTMVHPDSERALTGIAESPKEATLELSPLHQEKDGQPVPVIEGRLQLRYGSRELPLPIAIAYESRRRTPSRILAFKAVTDLIPFPDEISPHVYSVAGGDGWSYEGWITSASGTRFAIQLQINMGFDEGPNNAVGIFDFDEWTRPVQIQGGLELSEGRTVFEALYRLQ